VPEFTHPGVYVEEHSPGAPIEGVPTSTAAFVGAFAGGAVGRAVRVLSFSEFASEFSGLDAGCEASIAVHQFFLNGGNEAWVVRTERPPDAALLVQGLAALGDVDPLNLVCLPQLAREKLGNSIAAATEYCARRRAFLVLDPPNDVYGVAGLSSWLREHESLRHPNVALYFPRVRLDAPEAGGRSFGASGAVAGIFARVDAARGVWTAPAGANAVLRGVAALEEDVSDRENVALSAMGVNALRTLDAEHVVWGARTLEGTDGSSSDWKYVPVRRLALFVEESIDRGTRWVVSEPHAKRALEPVGRLVGAFLESLFRAGAFVGETQAQAYSFTCQTDVDRGTFDVVVGFAPLRPAEFVTVTIRQLLVGPKPRE
jgi:uncharacterized protein